MDERSVKNSSLYYCFDDESKNRASQSDVPTDETSICSDIFTTDQLLMNNDSTVSRGADSHEFDDCGVLIKAFEDAFETIYGDTCEINYVRVKQISEELQANCVRMVNLVQSQKFSIENQQKKSQCTQFEDESLVTVNSLQCQIKELNDKLKQQSTLNFTIGSYFGDYLWRATQLPDVIDMVLQKPNKMVNMAKLMSSILTNFIETYNGNKNMPSIKTHETKCVLNILGITANLSTTETGRKFFSQVGEGIRVVRSIVSLVSCTPSSLDRSIKKVAYASLYNVSIQFNGHSLMENNALVKTLQNDIEVAFYCTDINDTSMYALKLLHSLTKNINDLMYVILKKEIRVQEILKLTNWTPTESLAREVCDNLNDACKKYNDNWFDIVIERK